MFLYLSSVNENTDTDIKLLESAIHRLAQGDMNALGDVYDITHRSVYSYALSILKNGHDAEDVLQECMISVRCGAASYSSHGKPMAWILTVTRNLCYMKLRTRKKEPAVSIDEIFDLADESGVSAEDKIVLKQCLFSLSDSEREIVLLHAVSGLKHREIAQMLDMSLPTVLSKYSRAIKKLKKLLTQGETENEK